LLTGRYAHQVNMRTMSGELSPGYPTYPQALQRAGYSTACIGKTHWWQGWSWFDSRAEAHYDHRGLNEELKTYGFDRVWECWDKRSLGINKNDYTTHLEERGYGEAYTQFYDSIQGNTFLIEDEVREKTGAFPFNEADQAEAVVTQRLIDEVERASQTDQPFFIFGSYFAPHDPYDAPQRYLDRVPYEEVDDYVERSEDPSLTPEVKKQLWKLRRGYKASVLMLDEHVGRILNTLEAQGLLDETVILFTSDHGDLMGDHSCTQKGLPFKQSVCVPAMIRHPDYLHGLRNQSPVEITDLIATILDVAGLDPVEALSAAWPSYQDHIPCRSLMPILRAEVDSVRDYAFSECDMKWHDAVGYQRWSWQMVMDVNWKYIRYLDRKAMTPATSRREWLIDRQNDPEEIKNTVDENLEVVTRMSRQLDFINDTTPTAQTNWIPFGKRSP
jgi:arylsulfatase A-like enzyme